MKARSYGEIKIVYMCLLGGENSLTLIQVNVRLYGELKTLLETGGSEVLISLPNGSTLEALNKNLGICIKDVVVILVNRVAVNKSYVLKEGDQVDIFPPLSGG